jgi:ABC-2 type transport system ATP-binding protein
MSDKEIAISVKNLSKDFKLPHERQDSIKSRILNPRKQTFEVFHALKDISFEVHKGEFFGIVGRNGSGKSTLLKTLGGIYQPSNGTLQVNGTLTPFIELGIGFNPELSGRENIFLNGAILGLTRKEINKYYDEIVAYAELEKFMDQKLKNYSSGMQVRLAFSIAMRAHNDILLIDEVLAVGDADFQRKCFETFKSIKQSDKTVVFVSHDMNAIREYCERAIMIEDGKIVASGSPDVVANDYIQLFNKDASAGPVISGRWGDLKAEVSNVKVLSTEEALEVSFEVSAKEDITNPIFGLIIKDIDNNHLIDSNTKWSKVATGSMNGGKRCSVTWKFKNVLKTGKYSLTVAAAHSNGLGYYDWQDDAVTFNVYRKKETAGLIAIDDKITIKKA